MGHGPRYETQVLSTGPTSPDRNLRRLAQTLGSRAKSSAPISRVGHRWLLDLARYVGRDIGTLVFQFHLSTGTIMSVKPDGQLIDVIRDGYARQYRPS